MPAKVIDETDNVYGLLTVKRRADGNGKDKFAMWECECACGGTKITRGITLRRGECISCGCQKQSKTKSEYRTNRTHRVTSKKQHKAGNAAWQALGD